MFGVSAALAASVTLALVTTAACAPSNKGFKVQTTNGPIQGHPAENRTDVNEFLGIPFAQPPVGDLRFAAPQEYEGKGLYVASEFGFDCPQGSRPPFDIDFLYPQAQQIVDYFSGNSGTTRDEDCLTLNLWTKATKKDCKDADRPILVFFYGGRTSIGNANSPFYDGQYFADAEDVIVVTVNYRLNIFGFPGAPGNINNLGFRDQRLAVEWVRDNAAAFGGDSSKITIFGQSSGGVAVDYWSYAYTEDPIVSGLISQSGNALSFPMNPEELTLNNWYNVSAELDCGSEGDTVPCMRTKDWQDILAAAGNLPNSVGDNPTRSIPPFYPRPDDEVVFENYTELALAGEFAKLPYLLGNTNNEQGYYFIPSIAAGANPTEEQGDALLLSSFTCANMFAAETRRKYDVPVWQYRYFGDWDNVRLYDDSGAYHGTESQMIFGNDDVVSGIPSSRAQDKTTRIVQRAWAKFAADPAEGLSRLGWPEYDPEEESLVRIAYANRPRVDFVSPTVYDAPCSTVELGAYAT